jgi:hypothetical protein
LVRNGCLQAIITTSLSSEAEPAEERWLITWRHRGKRILLLERGGYLPREKDNWDAKAVFVESKYRAKETWYDKDGKAFLPGIQYYVGGNTKVYGAAL